MVTQSLSDTILVSDTLSTIKSITQTLEDNITVSDTLSTIKSITQTLITVSDTLSYQINHSNPRGYYQYDSIYYQINHSNPRG